MMEGLPIIPAVSHSHHNVCILFVQLFHIASKKYLFVPDVSDTDKSPVVGEQTEYFWSKFVEMCKMTFSLSLLIGLRLSLRMKTHSFPQMPAFYSEFCQGNQTSIVEKM